MTGILGDQTDDEQAQKASALAANVEQAKILAARVFRNDLGVIGTGKRLNASLEASNRAGQKPELPQLVKLDREQGDQEVGGNANLDELGGIVSFRQAGKGQTGWKRHDLRKQQREQQAGRIQTQARSIRGRQVDDRVHPVDEKEERQQKQEHFPFLSNRGERFL